MTDHQLGLPAFQRGGAHPPQSYADKLGILGCPSRIRAFKNSGVRSGVRAPALPNSLPIYIGDILKISVADEESVPAEVVWTSGENCGLRFIDPFDCALMLAEILDRAQARRSPRLKEDQLDALMGCAQRAAGIRRSQTLDYSDEAGGIEVGATLEAGQKRRGILRWIRGELAYVQLTH